MRATVSLFFLDGCCSSTPTDPSMEGKCRVIRSIWGLEGRRVIRSWALQRVREARLCSFVCVLHSSVLSFQRICILSETVESNTEVGGDNRPAYTLACVFSSFHQP